MDTEELAKKLVENCCIGISKYVKIDLIVTDLTEALNRIDFEYVKSIIEDETLFPQWVDWFVNQESIKNSLCVIKEPNYPGRTDKNLLQWAQKDKRIAYILKEMLD